MSLTDATVQIQDSSGNIVFSTAQPAIVAGAGTAGTPGGGVVSIQGVAGGLGVPTSFSDAITTGTITAVAQTITTGTLNGASDVLIQLTGAWVGSVTFEVTRDGATWISKVVRLETSGNTTTGATTANNTYRGALAGYSGFRIRSTAWTSGTLTGTIAVSAASSSMVQVEPLPAGSNTIGAITGTGVAGTPAGGVLTIQGASGGTAVPVVDSIHTLVGYSAAVANLTSANATTDLFTIQGSATKTVSIERVEIYATGSVAQVRTVLLIKRSTANTGGTSTSPTAVPHDSNNTAATATVFAYTANPTVGTSAGNVRTGLLLANTTAAAGSPLVWAFEDQPIVLHGTAQELSVNLNGVTTTGGSFDIAVQWTEA